MSILEKGVWDDIFSIEGGGLIHMKLEFILNNEDRNRIRSVRESAIKKKQAEVLGSRLRNAENDKFLVLSLNRHEVSDVSRATSSQDFQRSNSISDASPKASESLDGIKEESFQRQSLTNATDTRDETPFSHMTKEIEQNIEDKIPSDAKKTNEESTSNKNNELLLQQPEVSKQLLEDTKTRDSLKSNNAVKTIPSGNLVEKLDQQNLEDKNPSFLKKMSKEREFAPFSQETEANKTKTNETRLQGTGLPKRLKDSSSSDVGPSRLIVAEKIKSFSPKLAGEMDKQASLEKSPQNIKKMISVFESSLSKDNVPLKSLSTKSNRFGTSRLLKEKLELNIKNSETSSSTRLRSSFSTGDLRKDLSSIITKEDQVESDDDLVESAETNMHSKGNDPNQGQGDKTTIEEQCHQEKIVDKGEETESSKSTYTEASNGSFGQAMKIALVVGFGVVVLFFRQRETGKGKKENTRAPRNVVVMNNRGSIEEQRRRIGASRLS
ncbi:uncharacterized protein LOC143592495 isoform X2 [Bidens hawaiensis]